MKSRAVLYIGHTPVTPDHRRYRFSEAERKKVAGVRSLLEKSGINVETVAIAPINKGFFDDSRSNAIIQAHPILYWIIRLATDLFTLSSRAYYIAVNARNIRAVIIYNYYAPCLLLAGFCRYLFHIPVILDYEDGLFLGPKKKLFRSILEKLAKKMVDGHILVNEQLGYRLDPCKPSITLNGVFNDNVISSPSGQSPPRILYSGNINSDNGLQLLLEAISALDNAGIKVDITGGGRDTSTLKTYINSHELTHVTYHGFVELDVLQNLETAASGFMLFQNTDSPIYDTNFPSKIFHYIQLGKPVFFNKCQLLSSCSHFINSRPLENPSEISHAVNKSINQEIDIEYLSKQISEYQNAKSAELADLVVRVTGN